jgi:hypothetical protein
MAGTTLVSGCDRYGLHAAARIVTGKFGMWQLHIVSDIFANKFTINM